MTNVPNSPLYFFSHTMPQIKRTRRIGYGQRTGTTSGFVRNMVRAARAGYNVYRGYQTVRGMFQRPRITSGQGVTAQYDRKVVYTKKTMPRAKRKRWVSFLRKNIAADMKWLGTKTFLFNHTIQGVIGPGAQDIRCVHLYGQNASAGSVANTQVAEIGFRDLQRLADSIVVTPGDTVRGGVPSSKAIFGSAILDVTFYCAPNGRISTDPTTPQGGGLPMEVDVYEIVYRKDTKDPAVEGVRRMYELGLPNQDAAQPDTAGSPTFLTRGWTPFDAPQVLSQYGVKILKKTKFVLSVGQSATYQVRDPKNRIFDVQDMRQNKGFARKGYTRTLIFLYKVLPGSQADPGIAESGRIVIGATRKYMYKMSRSGSSDQSNFFTGAG